MPERIDQSADQPSLTPQPNQIMSTPATVQACAVDYSPRDAAARDQLAHARIHGNEQGATR